MRRVAWSLLAVPALLAAAVAPAAPATASGLTSGPIEYVKTVPFDAGAAQVAKKVGDHLYVTSWKALSVYDVSDLLDPVRVSTIPTGFQFPAERMDTNGEILIIGEQTPVFRLHVFDVSDPEAPSEIATLDGTPTTPSRACWDAGGPTVPTGRSSTCASRRRRRWWGTGAISRSLTGTTRWRSRRAGSSPRPCRR